MNKILVIEDEKMIRENLCELLTLEDYEVVGVENGKIGVAKAVENLPDLIICDLMMPELDGYGVLHQLKRNSATKTIPLIFLTAKRGEMDCRQGLELGADDYLTKPFRCTELLGTINTHLAKKATVKSN